LNNATRLSDRATSGQPLILRPLGTITVAYFAAAAVAGCTLGTETATIGALQDWGRPTFSLASDLGGGAATACVGTVLCLIVEALLVTPILLSFHRVRWHWSRRLDSIVVGFALAAVPTLLLFLTPIEDGLSVAMGYNLANGQPTLRGALRAAQNAALIGLVGAACASVFQAIAFRRERAIAPPRPLL
jgi:hypothetical protein